MTWALAGLALAAAAYAVILRRRVKELRRTVRELRSLLSSARTTRKTMWESNVLLERHYAALYAERDELLELLTTRAGHVVEMETAMVAADHDAAMYQQRMRDYDEELKAR